MNQNTQLLIECLFAGMFILIIGLAISLILFYIKWKSTDEIASKISQNHTDRIIKNREDISEIKRDILNKANKPT